MEETKKQVIEQLAKFGTLLDAKALEEKSSDELIDLLESLREVMGSYINELAVLGTLEKFYEKEN
jgi:hypothetical protein